MAQSPLTGDQLAEFKKMLLDEKARIEAERADYRGEEASDSEEQEGGDLSDVDPNDPADEASNLFDRDRMMAATDNMGRILGKIERALQKMDEGTYGLSDIDSTPIPIARLEALPYALTTVEQEDAFLSRPVFYFLAVLVLVADQLTKQWVLRTYPTWPDADGSFSRVLLPGFFSLTFVHNTGGAFGILPSGTQLLALAALVAAGAIVVYTLRAPSPLSPLLAVALALPLGGSLGNLLDRVRLHYVVDFLDLHIATHYWPVFNVADSAICVGVALLAVYFWRQPVGDKAAPLPVKEDV